MFKRGFKAWCENTAGKARRQIDVDVNDPLDPYKLATSLGATILYPEKIPGLESSALSILLNSGKDSWSAVTLTLEPHPIIVLNSAHSLARRASSVAHEIAHLLLAHRPSQTGISPGGFLLTAYDRDQENEADWLAGCLLLPRETCLQIRRQHLDTATTARKYGVSQDMLRFRMNTTGVERQASRWYGKSKAFQK